MLVSNKKLPYISVFKTHSGEEFIAKVVDESITSYTVEKPLCMIPTERGLQFAPFMMMADPEKEVSLPKPMITSAPREQICNQYEAATSKIAVPVKQSIIT